MIESQPKPDWIPLPRPGCKNVKVRVMLRKEGILIANLQLGKNGTIDKHDAHYDIDVICLSGSDFASIDDEAFPFHQGETIRWPKDRMHCLWTEETTMETLMVERYETMV